MTTTMNDTGWVITFSGKQRAVEEFTARLADLGIRVTGSTAVIPGPVVQQVVDIARDVETARPGFSWTLT